MCFTYGTWFAIGGLTAAGKTYNNCETIRKAVGFLLKSQRADGGWGESYLSCPNKVILVPENFKEQYAKSRGCALFAVFSIGPRHKSLLLSGFYLLP